MASQTISIPFMVAIPPGVAPGMTFMSQTPHGMVNVTVPHGMMPGMQMQIQVPILTQTAGGGMAQMSLGAGAGMAQSIFGQQQPMMMQPTMPQAVPQAPQPMVMQPKPQPQPQPSPPVVEGVLVKNPEQHQTAETPPAKAPPDQSAATGKKEKKKVGAFDLPAGQLLYSVQLSAMGENYEGCCDRTASPVGLLEAAQKRATPVGDMPSELKGKISDEAWELILDKLVEHQKRVPYPVPCCEYYCMYTCFCCCACGPCFMCYYPPRDQWEEKVEGEINSMLAKYNVKFDFAKEGNCGQFNVEAKFLVGTNQSGTQSTASV